MSKALNAIALSALMLLALAPASGADDAANVHVTTVNTHANEIWIAVNPTNPLNLIAVGKDYTQGTVNRCSAFNVWMGIYVSFDGGATWENTLAPGHAGDPGQVLSEFTCSSDPIVEFASDGTAYFNGLAIGPSGSAQWVGISEDGGRTISDVTIAHRHSGLLDKNMMAVDPLTETVYVAYANFGAGARIEIVAGIPVGGTIVWLRPVSLGTSGSSPMIDVLPNGFVQLSWISSAGGNAIYTAQSPPLAQRFGARTLVTNNAGGVFGIPNSQYRAYTLPTSQSDPVTGVVYITWHGSRSGGIGSDVWLAKSGPMGAAPWSAPVRVNQVAAHDQIIPNVAVGPDGKVAVAYYDRRDDPTNRLLATYVSVSADGGATWTDTRVSDVAFDGSFGYHQNGFSFIGDYNGIAATAEGVHVAWADTRDYSAPRTGSEVYYGFLPW